MKLLDYTQGNILSLYWIQEDSLYLYEIPFYGSSRLGVIKENKLLKVKTAQNNTGVMSLPIPVNIAQSKNTTKPGVYTMGKKHYETTDWLGNVRVTYTDKKIWSNGKFSLNVSSTQDYYPFGSVMEGRNLEITNYRFGFQGQEGDDEVFGKDNLWAYKYRLHDARLGRFFSVDPLAGKYPFYSMYQFSGNRVIDMVELEGLEPGIPFNSATEAALNFGKYYGVFSIIENREYSATIYVYMDKDGKTKYTYNNPKRGTKSGAPPNRVKKREGKAVAGIHSHGAYDYRYDNNNFSPDDINFSENEGVPEYITTPSGLLKKYDPVTEEVSVISEDLPSDPSDPEKRNTNHAMEEEISKKERNQKIKEYRKIRKEFKKEYRKILKERE